LWPHLVVVYGVWLFVHLLLVDGVVVVVVVVVVTVCDEGAAIDCGHSYRVWCVGGCWLLFMVFVCLLFVDGVVVVVVGGAVFVAWLPGNLFGALGVVVCCFCCLFVDGVGVDGCCYYYFFDERACQLTVATLNVFGALLVIGCRCCCHCFCCFYCLFVYLWMRLLF